MFKIFHYFNTIFSKRKLESKSSMQLQCIKTLKIASSEFSLFYSLFFKGWNIVIIIVFTFIFLSFSLKLFFLVYLKEEKYMNILVPLISKWCFPPIKYSQFFICFILLLFSLQHKCILDEKIFDRWLESIKKGCNWLYTSQNLYVSVTTGIFEQRKTKYFMCVDWIYVRYHYEPLCSVLTADCQRKQQQQKRNRSNVHIHSLNEI